MEIIQSDLTVVGAGIAGICAALAAARNGLKVILINDRPVVGGNASSEIGISMNGSASNGYSCSVYARESGIVEELKLILYQYNKGEIKRQASWDAAFFDMIYGEENISLFLNTLVYDVELEQAKVKSVTAVQLGSERKFRFESPLFIDSSGDGIVGAKAGALYMWGRESRDTFHESHAPQKADSYTLGDTLHFHSRNMGKKVLYKRPKFAYDITKLPFFKDIGTKHRIMYRFDREFHGYWWIEFGGQMNTVFDNEAITLELRKLVYGFWDYIKNSGEFENVDDLALDVISPIAGKRESRRFIGDYILTQNDLENKTDFEDAVAIGGWPMDVHAPKGIYDEGYATHWHFVPGIYNIPFRALYSKNIQNLMLAGRNVSCSQVAFGSTRVMCTGGNIGQAVGTAAVLCKKYGIMPSGIIPKYYDELLFILQNDDQTIMGKKYKDNRKLTEDAVIIASSEKNYSNEITGNAEKIKQDMCLTLPVVTEKFESFEVKIRNFSNNAVKLKIWVYGGKRKENYIVDYKIKELTVDVLGKFDEWIMIPVQCDKPEDSKVYIVFESNSELGIYCNNENLTGAVSFKSVPIDINKEQKRIVELNRMGEKNICFKNVQPQQNLYRVQNVVNGYSRPHGVPNIWISEELEKDVPQIIEMKYDKLKLVKEIHLIFNTALEEDNIIEPVKQLVKDYEIEITTAEGEKHIVKVEDNIFRYNKHQIGLNDVKEIKFIFKSNYGARYIEVYAVKLF